MAPTATLPSISSSSHRRVWTGRLVLALILVAIFSLLTVGEVGSTRSAHQALQSRFENRLVTASSFLSTYVRSELRHEQTLAKERLSGPVVTQSQFDAFAQDFGYGPSLLLDSKGRVLDVIPRKAGLLGVDIAPQYAHLTIALSGRENVSKVVSSAVQHLAVVAFAVPFSTPQGRRVMSGTSRIAFGPLGEFLQTLQTIPGSTIYLADDSNRVIASAPRGAPNTHLASALVALGPNSQRVSSGAFLASVSVAGTPWKILATLPTSALYRPIDGVTRIIPWLILLGFALLAIALGVVLLRSWERKLHLADEAGIDPLTQLANRRQFEERTSVLFSASRRHRFDLAVMMIDIDHFKFVNDQHGHEMGDRVLKAVANCVRGSLRTEDVGARWGGEEFAIVLPYTNLTGAVQFAQRLRGSIAETSLDLGGGVTAHVTVSIGVAADVEGVDPAELLPLADLALFRAKDQGRNRVEAYVLPPTPVAL